MLNAQAVGFVQDRVWHFSAPIVKIKKAGIIRLYYFIL
jgi:hypothetical protein